jgi:hypothetical protein
MDATWNREISPPQWCNLRPTWLGFAARNCRSRHVAFFAPCPIRPISRPVRVSPAIYPRINEYRHTARHDRKNQALVTLLAAGLAAGRSHLRCRQSKAYRKTQALSAEHPKRLVAFNLLV